MKPLRPYKPLKPFKPYKPYAPYSNADFKWIFLFGGLLIIVLVAGYFLIVPGSQPNEQPSIVNSESQPDGQSTFSRFGEHITDPEEIAFLDEEFGDLAPFGYSSDIVYRRNDLVSDQLEAGCGPLHQVRGCEILIGKTGSVAVAYYATGDAEVPLIPEPKEGTKLCLLLLDGYTAQENWWNRPVASCWCQNGTLEGREYAELSMYSPWPEAIDADTFDINERRSVSGWFWNGEAYVMFNQSTTLAVYDGRLDFVPLVEPSSP